MLFESVTSGYKYASISRNLLRQTDKYISKIYLELKPIASKGNFHRPKRPINHPEQCPEGVQI